jgi:multisubunit Na+/H+ antiporter MnhB subunit
MSQRLPRVGELAAFAGALGVAVALALRWYETPGGSLDAWDTFGVAVALLIVAALTAVGLMGATLTERSPSLPIAAAVWTTVWGFVASIAAIVRLFERPDGANGLCAGAWIALAGAVLILLGGWLSMRDERKDRYPPAEPERRPPPA